jgi:hypothetical protein
MTRNRERQKLPSCIDHTANEGADLEELDRDRAASRDQILGICLVYSFLLIPAPEPALRQGVYSR